MKRLVAIAALVTLALLGLWHVLRPDRVNAWDVRNLPIAEGPIICFGDSLVEGVGASGESDTYPAQLGRLIGREVDAYGVSGRTTAEGLRDLRSQPALRAPLVVLTLGGNDLLHRTPLAETRDALEELIRELQARGCAVAYSEVLGVVPGERAKMHRAVCRKLGVILVPDIMAGILRNQDLLSDAVHPNDAGYALIAQRVATVLEPYLSGGVSAGK